MNKTRNGLLDGTAPADETANDITAVERCWVIHVENGHKFQLTVSAMCTPRSKRWTAAW